MFTFRKIIRVIWCVIVLTGLCSRMDSTAAVDAEHLFTLVETNLPGIAHGKVAWADYDSDGDLDIAITGYISGEQRSIAQIYRNTEGLFEQTAALANVHFSTLAWGDYDNDNDLDLLLAGWTPSFTNLTQLYRNDVGVFVQIDSPFQDVDFPSLTWGDYDNDGDQDVVVTGGTANNEGFAQVYRNVGGIFEPAELPIVQTTYGATWVDYDSDSDLDLSINRFLYRNDNGNFTPIAAAFSDFPGISTAWGDYDNDGDFDFLMTGSQDSSTTTTKLYQNTNGVFTDAGVTLPGVWSGDALKWGDYDNDGDLDIFIAGNTEDIFIAKIF